VNLLFRGLALGAILYVSGTTHAAEKPTSRVQSEVDRLVVFFTYDQVQSMLIEKGYQVVQVISPNATLREKPGVVIHPEGTEITFLFDLKNRVPDIKPLTGN
jgi:hypothetical protein